MSAAPPPAPSALTWSWAKALLGFCYALPAALVTRSDPHQGLVLAVGVMCAAAVGLPARRRARIQILLIGASAGLGLFVGSLLGGVPTLGTMLGLFVLAVLASVTSPLTKLGPFLLVLALPMVAAGVNFASPSDAVSAGLLLLGGTAYAFAISLLWPEPAIPAAASARPEPAARSVLLDYGVRLGLAAAISIGVGLLAGIDHPGWAATSALLVGRPNPALTDHRVLGRSISVLLGAGVALILHAVSPTSTILAVCVGVALAVCCAVTGSWWYITPAFTSFVVLTMLMVTNPAQTTWWAAERVAGTLFGVVTAWVLLSWFPRWRTRRAQAGDPSPN